jgi:ABC-type uncharacterized transport system substrate-binding protein
MPIGSVIGTNNISGCMAAPFLHRHWQKPRRWSGRPDEPLIHEFWSHSYDFTGAIGVAVRERAEALLVLSSPIVAQKRAEIAALALTHRLPAMYQAREWVTAGGLMSYGLSYPAMYRRAADYVDRIVKGAKPADLPIEQPTTFELVLNRASREG